MHAEARAYVSRFAHPDPIRALDLGGRDINGHARDLFPAATWMVLDQLPGPGVTIISDATAWSPWTQWDLVLCTEVLEHEQHWRRLLYLAGQACLPGGRLILTCAGVKRAPHSGIDGGPVRPGEWYRGLEFTEVHDALEASGWSEIEVDLSGPDVYATARA